MAVKLVNEWNKLNKVRKNYEIIVPVIVTKANMFDSLLRNLMQSRQMTKEDVLKFIINDRNALPRLIHMHSKQNENGSNKEVIPDEVVIVEDYLEGHFTKWNSNVCYFIWIASTGSIFNVLFGFWFHFVFYFVCGCVFVFAIVLFFFVCVFVCI